MGRETLRLHSVKRSVGDTQAEVFIAHPLADERGFAHVPVNVGSRMSNVSDNGIVIRADSPETMRTLGDLLHEAADRWDRGQFGEAKSDA